MQSNKFDTRSIVLACTGKSKTQFLDKGLEQIILNRFIPCKGKVLELNINKPTTETQLYLLFGDLGYQRTEEFDLDIRENDCYKLECSTFEKEAYGEYPNLEKKKYEVYKNCLQLTKVLYDETNQVYGFGINNSNYIFKLDERDQIIILHEI